MARAQRAAFAVALAAFTCRGAGAERCPAGWAGVGDGACFQARCGISTYRGAARACAAGGARLAGIDSAAQNELVRNITAGAGRVWIGLDSEGRAEGDWRWVDADGGLFGTTRPTYVNWHPGEPNNYAGRDEDCAIMRVCNWQGGDGTWYDAPCDWAGAHYVCRSDRPDATAAASTPQVLCDERPDDVCGRGECYLLASPAFKKLYAFVGLPCVLLNVYVVLRTCGVTLGYRTRVVAPEGLAAAAPGSSALPSVSYGLLLGAPGGEGAAGTVHDLVNRWVLRGAGAAVLYAIALMALAATTVARQVVGEFSLVMDSSEVFVMFVCKLVVARSAHAVHVHLSPIARTIAGRWIIVLAWSKLLMSLMALVLMAIYVVVAKGTTREMFCVLGFLFSVTCLLSTVFQAMAGFALFRVHERAASYAENTRAFSRVVGCWWGALVGGTFGVGFGLWLSAAMFVLFPSEWSFLLMGVFYAVAAGCQLVAGLAMVHINSRVRGYFATPDGRQAVRDAIDLTTGVAEDEAPEYDEHADCPDADEVKLDD